MPTTKHNLLRLVLAFFCLEIFLHDSKRKMSAHRVAFENGQAHRNRSSIRKVMLKKRQGGSIIIAHSLGVRIEWDLIFEENYLLLVLFGSYTQRLLGRS